MQISMRIKSGLFTSVLVVGNPIFFSIITGGLEYFMFQSKQFQDFVHPHNLLGYFQNKEIDSNQIL